VKVRLKGEGDQQTEQREYCRSNRLHIRWLPRLVLEFPSDAPSALHDGDHAEDSAQCSQYGIRC